MKNKIIHIVICSNLIFVVLSICLTVLSKLSESPVVSVANDSILKDFNNIDYWSFIKLGLICIFISASIIYTVTSYCLLSLKLKDKTIERWAISLTKILSSLSIIIPMTFTFTKEQFNVATTFLSFLALFSFAIPKTRESNSDNRN